MQYHAVNLHSWIHFKDQRKTIDSCPMCIMLHFLFTKRLYILHYYFLIFFSRDSSLPLYLTLCKQTLFLLENPSTDSQLSSVHPHLLQGFKLHLRDLYSDLNRWHSDLEEVWKTTENRLTVLIQLYKHRERAKEAINLILFLKC